MTGRFLQAAFLTIALMLATSPVFGQAQFRLTPPVIELETGRGGTKVFSFELANDNKEKPLRFKIYTQDFDVDREGNAQLEAAGKLERSASRWITVEQKEVLLEPGKSKKISCRLALPASVRPGGYYSAVICELITDTPIQQDSGALIKWRIATLVKISVLGGGIERKLSIDDFFVRTVFDKDSRPDRGTVFAAALKNEGNIHLKVDGKLTVFDADKKRKGETGFDVGSGTLMPGRTRDFVAVYDKFLTEGDYIARATFRSPGVNPQEKEIPFSVRIASGNTEAHPAQVNLASLRLVPERLELKIPPGGFRMAGFAIQNQRLESVRIEISVDSADGIQDWFSIEPGALTIEGGKEGKVILKITVPSDAQEKSYAVKMNLTPALLKEGGQEEPLEAQAFNVNLEIPKL